MDTFKNKNSYSHLNRLSTRELKALLQKDIEAPGGSNTDMVMYRLKYVKAVSVKPTGKLLHERSRSSLAFMLSPKVKASSFILVQCLNLNALQRKRFLVNC